MTALQHEITVRARGGLHFITNVFLTQFIFLSASPVCPRYYSLITSFQNSRINYLWLLRDAQHFNYSARSTFESANIRYLYFEGI